MARTKKKVKPLNYTIKAHHWQMKKPNVKDNMGFVYEITNLITGMKYIGRKLFWINSKGKKVRQSPWGVYTGSSKRLNKDIEELGKSNFKFMILRLYPDKSSLRYGEVEMIIKKGALTKRNKDGMKLYYNGQSDKCYSPTCWYEGKKLVRR